MQILLRNELESLELEVLFTGDEDLRRLRGFQNLVEVSLRFQQLLVIAMHRVHPERVNCCNSKVVKHTKSVPVHLMVYFALLYEILDAIRGYLGIHKWQKRNPGDRVQHEH